MTVENAWSGDPLPSLKRFALVLTGDDARAEHLVSLVASESAQSRGGEVAAGTLQFMQFRRLYELWAEMERSKSVPPRLFEAGNANGAIRKGLDPQVAQILGMLPATHRIMLLLIYGENYSYAATARLLGIGVEQLMYALVRARLPFADLRRQDSGGAGHSPRSKPQSGMIDDAA